MGINNEKFHKAVALLFGCFECGLFTGCMIGWTSLVFVLEQDGIYSHLCTNGTNATSLHQYVRMKHATCREQKDMLMLAFTIGIGTMQVSALVTGWMFDKYGLRFSRIFAMTLFTSGSLMLGFASKEVPVIIFPGIAFIGISGLVLFATNIQIGNYFTTTRLVIVFLFNGFYDISTVVFMVQKFVHERGVTRKQSFIFLGVFQFVVVLISTFAILPKFKIYPRTEKKYEKCDETTATKDDALHNHNSEKTPVLGYQSDSNIVKKSNSHNKSAVEGTEQLIDENEVTKGLGHYVCSKVFLMAQMWQSFTQLRCLFYIGTLNPLLKDFSNNNIETVSYFTDVFSYFLLGGVLLGPLAGLLLHFEKKRLCGDNPTYYRYLRTAALPQAICSFFTLLLSVLTLLPYEAVFYLQFITLLISKQLCFGMVPTYIVMAFPLEDFGRIFGLSYTINGLIGLLQYPLNIWSEGENWLPPTIFLMVLSLISFGQPIFLLVEDKRTENIPRTVEKEYQCSKTEVLDRITQL